MKGQMNENMYGMLYVYTFIQLYFCIGYQINGDLLMLAKTWRFAADVLLDAKRVVDLKDFNDMVSYKLYINYKIITGGEGMIIHTPAGI